MQKNKNPTKEHVKKYKRKSNELGDDDDDKSAYICEDLTYNLIHYINLGVIEEDESRKNLSITNNQSIRIERKMIAIIMKVFAKENMVRRYQIPGLPYYVDLCFVAHKLIIAIDEDGHLYSENDGIRQKLIENLGFNFIRINPDPDVGIAKIYNYINKLSVKLAVNLAEKSLKEKFAKELLSYMCKTHKENLLAYNPIVKIGKREIATQLTKCGECQKKQINFFEKSKPRKKIL